MEQLESAQLLVEVRGQNKELGGRVAHLIGQHPTSRNLTENMPSAASRSHTLQCSRQPAFTSWRDSSSSDCWQRRDAAPPPRCPIIGKDRQHLLNIRSTACSEKSSAFTGTISLSMVPAGEGD